MEKRQMVVFVKHCTLSIVIFLCLMSPLHANNFAGVWSNEQGEFKTFSVALRKDGRGIVSTAIVSAPLRWEQKNDGILIKATLDRRVSELFLYYDRDRNVFLLKKGDSSRDNILRKISNEEPPDIEAQIESQERQEAEKRKINWDKTVLNSRAELIADLSRRMRQFDGTGIYYVNIRPEGQKAHFRVGYVNYHFDVSVLTLDKRIDKPSGAVATWEGLPEPPNLPTRYRMPDSNLQALESMLKEGGYKYSLGTAVGRGLWEVETYRRELHIHPDKDRDKILRAVEFIVNNTLREWSGPYVVSTPIKAAEVK